LNDSFCEPIRNVNDEKLHWLSQFYEWLRVVVHVGVASAPFPDVVSPSGDCKQNQAVGKRAAQNFKPREKAEAADS